MASVQVASTISSEPSLRRLAHLQAPLSSTVGPVFWYTALFKLVIFFARAV
jgi:hypothetical protein